MTKLCFHFCYVYNRKLLFEDTNHTVSVGNRPLFLNRSRSQISSNNSFLLESSCGSLAFGIHPFRIFVLHIFQKLACELNFSCVLIR